MFSFFSELAKHQHLSRPLPASLGIIGYFARYKKHYIYWRELSNGDIGIMSVLHESMNIQERSNDDIT